MLHQNALHGNAGLAGIGEAAGNAALGGIGKIGVAVDDDAGITAEFEHDLFLSRMPLISHPTGALPVKLMSLMRRR